LTCDRALLIGFGLDQARIDCKTFTTNQTSRDARLDNLFEHAVETSPSRKRSFRAHENAE
jgi:hypothetical protein